eukprot:Hpha_TRINITY_DN15236_c6_g7::TRINITY_DN15236_c6_g7_i1::g.65471::m.65471
MGGVRRYASFNARRKCVKHASAAVEVLHTRGDRQHIQWSGCVSTGRAVCGPFGSISLLRFMILGGVSSTLHPLERTAAEWRVKALTDEEAANGALRNWNGMLLAAMFIRKRGPKAIRVYSMTSRRRADWDQEGADEEILRDFVDGEGGEHARRNQEVEGYIEDRLQSLRSEAVVEESDAGSVVYILKEVGLQPC